MKDISKWIDNIIQDLVDTDVKLKDTILKLQVLAFHLEHSELKDWVDKELNGYKNTTTLPIYRKYSGVVYGKVMQDRGFGSALTYNKFKLPTEMISDKEIRMELEAIHMKSSVAELEHMLEGAEQYAESVSSWYFRLINENLANEWQVQSAWKPITKPSIEKVLNSIKSNLLNFLLELNKKIGDNKDYTIMSKKKEVDELFSSTIGKISANHVNVSIGDKSMQAVNLGESMVVGQGEQVTINTTTELKDLIKYIEDNLDKIATDKEDNEDMLIEIERLKTQTKREKPKLNIVNTALETIKGILMGVTSSAIAPTMIEKINHVLSML